MKAYETTYGSIPFNPLASRGRRQERGAELEHYRDKRPRTESLIQDDELLDELENDRPTQTTLKRTNPAEQPRTLRVMLPSRQERNATHGGAVNPKASSSKKSRRPTVEVSSEEEDGSDPEKGIVFVDDQELSNDNLLRLSNEISETIILRTVAVKIGGNPGPTTGVATTTTHTAQLTTTVDSNSTETRITPSGKVETSECPTRTV
ncbi:uncharacterized protein MELLADRAFT_105515 [Melampsora larici-populina 98AG31]|uniref:Uncharacterized protein n=1 Tax=Melampsora larici-populina (strain 98AG31 / pathotype 3-4-7) TaxID=747676 RepID=F4RIG8_MELLP|nr:uncharacterized protein MELLADRAFT_105515 [Melampsora larici-populina 98AG31]EGG07835.1 hypothetical protein MELLADRAFT_105515 [Melampsora larici-populina 98AG31]